MTLQSSFQDQAVLRALALGKTPSVAAERLTVGRKQELEAVQRNIELVASGNATMSFLIGDHGAGKTWLCRVAAERAQRHGLVTMSAELSPLRLLHGVNGEGLALYEELLANVRTVTLSGPSAIERIIDRFFNEGALAAEDSCMTLDLWLSDKFHALEASSGGREFGQVLRTFRYSSERGDLDGRRASLQWLRGQFRTHLDARNILGVSGLVGEGHLLDALNLWAQFIRLAGYKGLLVIIDEMRVLFDLPNSRSRMINYEEIAHTLNGVSQTEAGHLGILMACTEDVLVDPKAGMTSHGSLRSCLQPFLSDTSPKFDAMGLIRLQSLSRTEFEDLLIEINRRFCATRPSFSLLQPQQMELFLDQMHGLDDGLLTPRDIIQRFLCLLGDLEREPGRSVEELLNVSPAAGGANGEAPAADLQEIEF